MRTELVFFDTIKESKKGFIRSLIAFTFLAFYDTLFYQKINMKFLVTWLLLCSSIGVMLPKTTEEASTLGFLIGTVVYGILTVWLNYDIQFYIKGTLGVILASILTFNSLKEIKLFN